MAAPRVSRFLPLYGFRVVTAYMSYILNSLKGVYIGGYIGDYCGAYQGGY